MLRVTRPETYVRRCDECRQEYLHVKGAPTGWCGECVERVNEYAMLGAPPLAHDHFHLPLIRAFVR